MFYLLAAMALAFSLLMVTRPKAIQAPIFFCGALLAIAGIFLQLGAEFLFAMQVLVFAGGIAIVYFAALLYTRAGEPKTKSARGRRSVAGALLAVVVGAELCVAIYAGRASLRAGYAVVPDRNMETAAVVLFQHYLLPLEMISILLVVMMIGAVIVSRGGAE